MVEPLLRVGSQSPGVSPGLPVGKGLCRTISMGDAQGSQLRKAHVSSGRELASTPRPLRESGEPETMQWGSAKGEPLSPQEIPCTAILGRLCETKDARRRRALGWWLKAAVLSPLPRSQVGGWGRWRPCLEKATSTAAERTPLPLSPASTTLALCPLTQFALVTAPPHRMGNHVRSFCVPAAPF